MRFGRVIGTISPLGGHGVMGDGVPVLHLEVTVDDGSSVEIVRSQSVPILGGSLGAGDLAWQADQYTQETIGNELALAGWEPIGIAEEQDDRQGAALVASSPTYIVRLL